MPDSAFVFDPLDLPSVTVLMGHAGVGKTNCALGLAMAAASQGQRVTLADLDTVNPYFRSSDWRESLEKRGIGVIAPCFAGTTLDTPSLTGELDQAIARVAGERGDDPARERLIVDCGGDDDGATTLGRYAGALTDAGAVVLYAASAFRSLTLTAKDAAQMLPDMERNSHLRATAVLNTSNLASETTPERVRHGRVFALGVAKLLDRPLAATVVPEAAVKALSQRPGAGGTPLAREAEALLARDGSLGTPLPRIIDETSSPQIAALLTEGASHHEPLVLMPRFVVTPWDTIA